MVDEARDMEPQSKASPVAWFFNPFIYIAGAQALLLGLLAILASGVLGFLSRTHFDGVLDLHTGRAAPLSVFLLEGAINWLTLAVVLLIAGKIVSRTAFRAIDVLGTQALARWPMLIAATACLAPGYQRVTAIIAQQLVSGGLASGKFPSLNTADAVVAGLVLLVIILCVIWMVALMYRAYSICCNVKGAAAAVSFIAALLVAEVISKPGMIGLLFARLGVGLLQH